MHVESKEEKTEKGVSQWEKESEYWEYNWHAAFICAVHLLYWQFCQVIEIERITAAHLRESNFEFTSWLQCSVKEEAQPTLRALTVYEAALWNRIREIERIEWALEPWKENLFSICTVEAYIRFNDPSVKGVAVFLWFTIFNEKLYIDMASLAYFIHRWFIDLIVSSHVDWTFSNQTQYSVEANFEMVLFACKVKLLTESFNFDLYRKNEKVAYNWVADVERENRSM